MWAYIPYCIVIICDDENIDNNWNHGPVKIFECSYSVTVVRYWAEGHWCKHKFHILPFSLKGIRNLDNNVVGSISDMKINSVSKLILSTSVKLMFFCCVLFIGPGSENICQGNLKFNYVTFYLCWNSILGFCFFVFPKIFCARINIDLVQIAQFFTVKQLIIRFFFPFLLNNFVHKSFFI